MFNPIKIFGNWEEGFVLDNHMLNSEFLGYDDKGKEQFNNTRTILGELTYQLKYNNDRAKAAEVLELIANFLDNWEIASKIDLIIPVPPTKKNRRYQPVFEIANVIANYLKKPAYCKFLAKESGLQSKDGHTNLKGTIVQAKPFKKTVNILLIDDLYSTGATLNEACKVLKTDNHVNNIYVLIMTKTRR
ncbi:MAG: hypothetical protein LBR56_07895 [Sporomusaceae bacterium]|jgi:predicted amidophosphoribosyltransferase|nr:hypothetical protein [Sporomusaceae bacterium]